MEPIIRTTEVGNALRAARALTKRHGSSYYASTLLFPAKTRDAVFALYGLVRKADEIVDTEERNPERAGEALRAFEGVWAEAYANGMSTDPILLAAAWAFRQHQIPFSYSTEFFEAMRADTVTTRYATYEELEQYMYGSAAVVGLMLTRIIGPEECDTDIEKMESHAKELGYAMQLTNFLRDIREDYADRGRIYIPQQDMDRFGVTEEMIAEGKVTPEFKDFMKFEIARARTLYRNADAGIPMLARAGRKPVRLARVLYSKILDRIEDAEYDVFSKRRYTTRMQKIQYALPVLISR